ncbi:MAG: hypothetical protein MJZ98_01355 [Paludibacteraceae bacterium]|nr:hypothetical protein [Paludibacteraceae bacterium]
MLSANQTQVNKLFGIGQVFHHWQSMRIGWRWDLEKSMVELVAYWYNNKVRDYVHICYVKLYQPTDMMVSVQIVDGAVIFRCYVGESFVTRAFVIKERWQKVPIFYECFPYFGGYMPAPQNIGISIKNI